MRQALGAGPRRKHPTATTGRIVGSIGPGPARMIHGARNMSPAEMPREEAREILGLYGTWLLVEADLALILGATALEEDHQLPFWDAMIVEAARRCGAAILMTGDLQDGRELGGVRVENPFRVPAV